MLRVFILLCFAVLGCDGLFAQSGFVKSAGQPIPGATVTASQAGQQVSTVTDPDGHYSFPPLGTGTWTVSVEMFGFDTLKKDINYSQAKGPVNFDIALQEPRSMQNIRQFAGNRGVSQATENNGLRQPANAQGAADQELAAELNAQENVAPQAPTNQGTNEAFLVSGSLSPGMAQGTQADSGPDVRFQMGGPNPFGGPETTNAPGFGAPGGPGGFGPGGPRGFGGGRGGFAREGGPRDRRGRQAAGAQFGHFRRPPRIRGMMSFTLTNSALNAKPFSLNGLDIPQASYAQSRFSLILGGPLFIPKLVQDRKTQFFVTYFGTRARNPELFTETVPTLAERGGDFSQATQVSGNSPPTAVNIFDPTTRRQFPGNRIPISLLNPTALSLLNYYPMPNQPGIANNYQWETAQVGDSDNAGLRIQRSITSVDRVSLNFHYQRRDGTTAQPFGYSDSTSGYGLNTQFQWTRNIGTTAVSNAQIRFNRNWNQIIPYFSLGPDIAAELGIKGTSNNPIDNGPPTLTFTNFGSLSDGTATLTRNQSQGATESLSVLKGAHTITVGMGYTRADLATETNPNGRGTLSFTGLQTSLLDANGRPLASTGYDMADFLLGLPQSSSIRFGDTSNYFLQDQWNGYAQDEWKARPSLTLVLGVRYEYFSPFVEKYGRMANLDIAPGFTNVAVATPNIAGPYTGAFPGGLINPDLNNWSPRVALAWKLPHIKRSTIFRAGYGIYYNGQAYIQLARQLAQQPPFAVSNAVNTSASNVLTLTDAFTAVSPQEITNTFAVDRNYRTPYAGTWNATLQHELPGNTFVELGYMGTKGTRLDVRTLPNQSLSPVLSRATQLGNAVGFTYDSSVGNSIFNALQARVVRRFSRSISFNAFYQFAKSIDDSSSFGGIGNTVAQNWLDIAAERGLSSFDVRHELNTSFVWTSPIGSPKSRIAGNSAWGRLLKDWQLSGAVTAQTGNPLTARILGNSVQLAQTGGVGSQRAEATGEPIDSGSGFFNLNAFTKPPTGVYGNAGRNTIPGPGTVNLNVAVARSFPFAERRRLEFRVEANNVLNHVNYTNLYTVVNAINYGLPSAAGSMRTLTAVVRFRF